MQFAPTEDASLKKEEASRHCRQHATIIQIRVTLLRAVYSERSTDDDDDGAIDTTYIIQKATTTTLTFFIEFFLRLD